MGVENRKNGIRRTPAPTGVLDESAAVLVRGPALSGKYELLMRLLSARAAHGLLVSTSRQAESARADFAAHAAPDRLAVVDCSTRVQGENGDDDALLRYASSPKNPTEIGVKFTDLVATLRTEKAEVTVGLYSLSELVMYWGAEQVFQFVRIMLGECRELGWPLVATVDDTAIDGRAISTQTQPFDTVIVTRVAEDGGQEFRLRQQGELDTAWTRL